MTAAVRLGSIGLGRWGEHLAEAVLRTGHATIERCYARTPSSRDQFAARFGCRPAGTLEQLLDDPTVDGVLIATPHSTHVRIVKAASAAGKHVFVEKPLSLTVRGGESAIGAAAAAGVTLQVANHRSRQAGIQRLKAWVDSGDLGVIQLLEANFSTDVSVAPHDDWKHAPLERPLGGMTTLGLHVLEDFVHLVGMPTRLFAMSKPVLGHASIDDITTLVLDFADGPFGYLGTGLAMPKMELLAVHGSSGSVWNEAVVAPGEQQLRADRLYRQAVGDLERHPVPNEPNDALRLQMEDFVYAVRSGGPPANNGTQALRMVTLIAAGLHSKRVGRPVDLSDFDPDTVTLPGSEEEL